jgi:hypothetical protein
MKKLLITLAVASLTFAGASQAQPADTKLEWATRVVALQQGPELDRLVEQLATGTTQELLQNWGPQLEAMPQAKQAQAKEQLNTELQKYVADVSGVISNKTRAASNEALIPAYVEKFSLEELKQIAAFFESPAIKKYQAAAPELGNVFVGKLVDSTRADVQARMKQFDDAAGKIIGAPAKAPAAPGPAKSKAPAKK